MTLLILTILFLLITIFMYLVIIGGNITKTNEERKIEIEEEIKFLNNYRKQKEAKDEKKIIKQNRRI